MRCVAPFIFGLAAASMVEKRQGGADAINNVFASLMPELKQLDSLINAYTSGPGNDVLAESDKIVGIVQQSIPAVNAIAPLDVLAAATIPGTVQPFTDQLTTTINDLIAHKQVAVSNGQGNKVYRNLVKQIEGAKALAKAIQSKLPEAVASVGDQLSGQIIAVLNKGLAAFQDQASAGAGAGAGAGGAGASPAGGAGAGLSIGGSSSTVNGSPVGSAAGGMSGMPPMGGAGAAGAAGAGAGAGAGAYGGAAPGGAEAGLSLGGSSAGGSPAVFTGAAASFKPTAVFGLVAAAVAVAAF